MPARVLRMVPLLVLRLSARSTTVPASVVRVVCALSAPSVVVVAPSVVVTMSLPRLSICASFWSISSSFTSFGLGLFQLPVLKSVPLGSPLASPSSTSLNCRNLISDS